MDFLDKLKRMTHPYDENEEEYDDYDDEPLEEEAPPAPRRSHSKNTAPEAPKSTPSRVVNINSSIQSKFVLVKPERYDLVSEIADNLRDNKAVVLNLESTNKDVARRLVDFLSGCAYALNGKIKKVAISTYIVTPCSFDFEGDLADELEESGKYF